METLPPQDAIRRLPPQRNRTLKWPKREPPTVNGRIWLALSVTQFGVPATLMPTVPQD